MEVHIDVDVVEPELAPLAADFNEMGRRLNEMFTTLRRFTSDASHELRTPLALLKTRFEVCLQDERDVPEYVETISGALDEINRLKGVVNGLLLLTRSESGEHIFRDGPVDMKAVVEDVVEFLEPLAEDKGIALTLDAGGAARVRGDGEWLHRLVFNLLDNAIKYCRPGDRITIRMAQDAAALRLEVADTGPGISPEHQQHIFERFWRKPDAETQTGAGIGLAICKWVVEGHNGVITVSDEPGGGAVFSVTLPADE